MKTQSKKNLDVRAIWNLSLFELRIHKNALIGWSVSMFATMFLYMILFPSMQDMAQMKLDAMPTELLQMFNMENFTELNDFVKYFGMIYSLALIAMAIFAAGFGVNLIATEEKTHRIEAICALPFSRTELYCVQVLTGFIGTLLVVASSIAATLLCGFINGGESFVVMDVITISKMAGFIPFFFFAFGLCLAGVCPHKASGYLGSGFVGVLYMLGYLSKLLGEDAAWLGYASPFQTLNGDAILAMEQNTMIALGVYFTLFVAMLIAGGMVYRKRDLAV